MAWHSKALTLSLVIPAYNEERYLRACLDSIAAQTEIPDEVIVVDNNSSDQTSTIAAKYPFVTLLHENRQGIVYARNLGFDAAKSQLIGRIDADTVLAPNWVASAKACYIEQKDDTSLCTFTGPSKFRNSFGSVWYVLHRVFFFWMSQLYMGSPTISGSNMVTTQKAWKAVRKSLCVRTDIHEDMDLALHLHLLGMPIIFTNQLSNSMLGRGYSYKLHHYLPMFFKIRFIYHKQ